MKISFFDVFTLCMVFCCVLFCGFFYPVLRDQFYYLGGYTNPFVEYYHSYLETNPRIGQFFSNLVGRNRWLQPIFAVLLFTSFFWLIYRVVFRRSIEFQKTPIRNFLGLIAGFVFLINYFGEMFFYVPYSGNYTFTHIFSFGYLFLIIDEFVYQKAWLDEKEVEIWFLILIGIFTGLGNEHTIPAVIGMYLFFSGVNYVKMGKLPNRKLLILSAAVILGYLLLFFAPANSVRFHAAGEEPYHFDFAPYFKNWKMLFKMYYYYNFELASLLVLMPFLGYYFRNKIEQKELCRMIWFSVAGIFSVMIAAYSPLFGTRILFFSNICFITSIFIFFSQMLVFFKTKIFHFVINVFLLMFFFFAAVVSFHAYRNYEMVTSQIEKQRKRSPDVVLESGFNYRFSKYLDRKVLLETGENYIDRDPTKDTSVERNLKRYYRLKTISIK
ncbi:DUF6056 family protein [Chryseobacterium koreense]|uniref:DUF6056 family protein n=1 Tax=Chryseobacterium koreense TaxID=232216 RepID=UPI0026EC7ED9|nr:DUF6056 family protein [Chryseobacterium koreense]